VSMVRRWLVIAGTLFAIGELIDGVVYRIPPGIVFAVVLGLCTWWASRSQGWAPSAVLGMLAVIEFVLVVFVYSRGDDSALVAADAVRRAVPGRRCSVLC
jgi:hypothetical protein